MSGRVLSKTVQSKLYDIRTLLERIERGNSGHLALLALAGHAETLRQLVVIAGDPKRNASHVQLKSLTSRILRGDDSPLTLASLEGLNETILELVEKVQLPKLSITPVATVQVPDPLDERSGAWFSQKDLKNLEALSAGTRLIDKADALAHIQKLDNHIALLEAIIAEQTSLLDAKEALGA